MESNQAHRPNAPQLWRLQKMIEWLRSDRRFMAHEAAAEFQVSRRTIMNDIEWLRSFGVPLAFDRRRRTYVATEGFGEMPALQIGRSEWLAITLAERVLEAVGAEPQARAVQKVVERIAQFLPGAVVDGADPWSHALTFAPGPTRPIPWLTELEAAVRDSHPVQITYYTQYRGTETERVAEPYHVLVRGGHGYLIAWCRSRRDVLLFRTDRIRALQPLAEVFVARDGFDLEAFLGPMFGVFKDREVVRVKVRFTPYMAPWIREEVWHPSQTLTDLPDGSVQLDMDVTGLTEVKRWVLGFGAEAEVIEPQTLRQAVMEEWARASGVGRLSGS